uniref:F-box domain-containing protein n=1 Tax=Mycena chlorophos TaxID=658473 RepID=A0ABQ0KVJ9_MYCCL|nr:predicted protein [Mycena chlorophos]
MSKSSYALLVSRRTIADLRPQSLRSRWLPADVLGEIMFESIPFAAETRFTDRYASYSPEPRAMLPISLSHVCREWRRAAIGFKKLWSFIDVDQTDDSDATLAYLDTYLARSGRYPLTIILTYPAAGHNHTILGRLLRESSRWRTFFCDVYGLFDASPRSTGLTYAQWTTLAFPELKNVVYFKSDHSDDLDDGEEENGVLDEDDYSSDSDSKSEGTDEWTEDQRDSSGDEGLGDDSETDVTGSTSLLITDTVEPDELFEKLLESLPGKVAAQLHRFYSYCMDAEFEEQMVIYLSQATRVRCAFDITKNNTHKYFRGTEPGGVYPSLPRAEYAMLAMGESDMTPNSSLSSGFLFRNELPKLRGLNLRVGWEGRDVFIPWEGVPMSGYLAKLVVLRLCGRIVIGNDVLTQLASSLSSLADLTLELREYGAVSLIHLNSLLIPRLPTIHIPRLEHLRLLPHQKELFDALVPALDARFAAPHGASHARLRSLTLYHTTSMLTYWDDSEVRNVPRPARRPVVEHSEKFKAKHSGRSGWNIQIVELQSDLWLEPMNGEFMLDI